MNASKFTGRTVVDAIEALAPYRMEPYDRTSPALWKLPLDINYRETDSEVAAVRVILRMGGQFFPADETTDQPLLMLN